MTAYVNIADQRIRSSLIKTSHFKLGTFGEGAPIHIEFPLRYAKRGTRRPLWKGGPIGTIIGRFPYTPNMMIDCDAREIDQAIQQWEENCL